jgi:hypothetical protein
MPKRLCSLLLATLFVGCGAPLTVSSDGQTPGWSFSRQALTSAEDGEVSFPMSGCRGAWSASVKAGLGFEVSEANATEWTHPRLDGHTWASGVVMTTTSKEGRDLVVLVRRGDQLVGKLRPVSARREGARYVMGIELESIEGP